jgi:hypothetical protein
MKESFFFLNNFSFIVNKNCELHQLMGVYIVKLNKTLGNNIRITVKL